MWTSAPAATNIHQPRVVCDLDTKPKSYKEPEGFHHTTPALYNMTVAHSVGAISRNEESLCCIQQYPSCQFTTANAGTHQKLIDQSCALYLHCLRLPHIAFWWLAIYIQLPQTSNVKQIMNRVHL